jgi:uncharacterized repeat protein (TIGR04076 family)
MFAVKATCRGFWGDVERFPCHFGYEVGDTITYDGGKIEGGVCFGIMTQMASALYLACTGGWDNKPKPLQQYSGLSQRDPSMKQYDGLGFRPRKEAPEGAFPGFLGWGVFPAEQINKGGAFTCGDYRTLPFFVIEITGLASGGDALPYYNRTMSVLQRVKDKPGMTQEEIFKSFSDFERDEIHPKLTLLNTGLMLDELRQVDYIELRDNKAYLKNPPK